MEKRVGILPADVKFYGFCFPSNFNWRLYMLQPVFQRPKSQYFFFSFSTNTQSAHRIFFNEPTFKYTKRLITIRCFDKQSVFLNNYSPSLSIQILTTNKLENPMLTKKHGAQTTPAHSLTILSFTTCSLWPRTATVVTTT